MLLIFIMRKLILILSLALLTGCSNVLPDSGSNQITEYKLPSETFAFFEHSDFRIQYPVSYETLRQNQLSSKFSNQAIVAFVSNFKSNFFTSNLVVEKVKVAPNLSSTLFAESVIENNKKQLNTYTELDRTTATSLVNSVPVTTIMIRFTGRLELSNDLVEYVQVYLTDGTNGYIATASYDPNDPNLEADKLIDSLKTFILK